MRLYLKMAFWSAIITLVFTACERMSKTSNKMSPRALTSTVAIK
jgi:hypothetical protein